MPLVERGDATGFADSREQVIIQPSTQRKVGLNCFEINKQPISIVENFVKYYT